MKYATYTGTIRNNLCDLLARQREIEGNTIKLNESIDIILSVPSIEKSTSAALIIDELIRAIEFFEKINSDYEAEVMRLTRILLEK